MNIWRHYFILLGIVLGGIPLHAGNQTEELYSIALEARLEKYGEGVDMKRWYIGVFDDQSEKRKDPAPEILARLRARYANTKPASAAIISSRLHGVYDRTSLEPGLLLEARVVSRDTSGAVLEVVLVNRGGTDCYRIELERQDSSWKLMEIRLLWVSCG